jgi:glycosyltransferase 2 family protein
MLPGLVISLVSLAAVFYFADLGAMLEAVRQANLVLILATAAISVLWLLVRAMVWRTLLQNQATLRQTFLTINEGYLLNNLLPFRLGEVGRAYLLSQKTRLGFWQVLPTILIERVFDLAMAAGLLLISLPLVVGATWARQAVLAAIGIVVLGLGGLYLLARNRDWVLAVFQKLSLRWAILQRIGQSTLTAFFSGLSVFNHGSVFLQAVLLMALNWLVAAWQYYVLLLAFLPQAPLLWAAFSLGVAALGIAAPSSPGAIGVLELSLVGALSLFGVDPSTALAFALTAHLLNYVVTGTIGAYALALDGESLSHLYQRVRRISKAPEA